ncbi:MAG: hypothetical protein HQM15_05610 [Deltaproteobacteria bacterium]|nr:hypothetical protein [Deltaproteobacteria bacterium]
MKLKINYKIIVLSSLLLATLSHAQTPGSLKTLFPQKSDLSVSQAGWQRIDLTPEIRSKIQSDYSDLRIFDAQGKETPFFVGQYQGPKEVPASQEQVLKVLNAKREKVKENIFLETYEIELPGSLNEQAHYFIVLKSLQDNFVKQVQIKNKEDDAEEALLEKTSLFRYGRAQEKMSIDWNHKGVHKILFSLEGEGDYLEPTFHWVQENENVPRQNEGHSEEARKDVLSIVDTSEEGKKTVLIVGRPSGIVPESILLKNSDSNYSRSVKVFDVKKGQEVRLVGVGKIFNGLILGETGNQEIRVSSTFGDKLKIEIENEDSPPLVNLSVEALSRNNLLFFFVDSEKYANLESNFGSLYFGGARVKAPRYDLQELAQGVEIEKLFLSSHEVQLAPVTANGDYIAEKSFEEFLKPGIQEDPKSFAYSQSLKVSEPGGIVAIPLSLAHLENLRKDLGDFRILDKDQQQWPYQLSRDTQEVKVELNIQKQNTQNQKTIYKITNPHPKIDLSSIQLKIDNLLFDRPYQIFSHRGEVEEQLVSTGSLYRRPGSSSNISISLGRLRFESLELIVSDGNEQALELSQATSNVETPIFNALLKGDYTLYFGNPNVLFPTYEITQFKDLIENLQEAPSELGPIQKNILEAKVSQVTREMGGGGEKQFYLWILLGAALVVLAVFSLRLAKGGEGK